jgi:two-component system OmpR family response regulator
MEVLVVEDELEIARLIAFTLGQEGLTCHLCGDGLTALQMVATHSPDVVILDWLLPGLDGLEVCARIRQKPPPKDPYILMLTAKGEEIDRIVGLSTGADDYLVKPFSTKELAARTRALLRRSLRHGGQTLAYKTTHFVVDVDQRIAQRYRGETLEELELSNLEFNLLAALISHPGRVWPRSQLIDKLWGNNFFGDERVVDTHVARLRKKVEPDASNPTFIKTVVGVGYKFEDS